MKQEDEAGGERRPAAEDRRAARLATAMRANLKKRKQQENARAARPGAAVEPD